MAGTQRYPDSGDQSHSKEVPQDFRDGVNDSASKTGQVTRKGGHWGAPGMAGIHWELGGELSLQREGVMGTKEGGNFQNKGQWLLAGQGCAEFEVLMMVNSRYSFSSLR